MKQFIYFYLLLIANIANGQQFNLNQGQFLDSTYFIKLPYEEVRGKVIIQIELGEVSRNFILDTGAPTSIKESVYKTLKLKNRYKGTVSDINDQIDSLIFTQIPSLKIGAMEYVDISALVLKENLLTKCFQVDGLLGSNIFRILYYNLIQKINNLLLQMM